MYRQQPHRLANKKQETNKATSPNNLDLNQFFNSLLMKWDFCLHQTCQERTSATFLACARKHGTHLTPELDPRWQKSVLEKTEWEMTGRWKWKKGKHSTCYLKGRHGRRNREALCVPRKHCCELGSRQLRSLLGPKSETLKLRKGMGNFLLWVRPSTFRKYCPLMLPGN